jgi:hypothetical protein
VIQCISTGNRHIAKYMKSDIKYTIKIYKAFLCDAMYYIYMWGCWQVIQSIPCSRI